MRLPVVLCVVVVAAVVLASFVYGSQDNHRKCKKWAEGGRCTKKKVKKLCPKSCNLGGDGGGGGGGSCGVSRLGHSRVIGGDNARPGAWPWQVGLHNSRGGFFCGGTLITPEWVVTAAHCISSLKPSNYVLRLGDHNRHRNEGTEQNIPASRVIKHPSYGSGGRLNNDIALIKLSQPADINDRVSPACLPNANYIVPPRTNCYITGWGKIEDPGNTYHTLQQAKISPVSESDCKRIRCENKGRH